MPIPDFYVWHWLPIIRHWLPQKTSKPNGRRATVRATLTKLEVQVTLTYTDKTWSDTDDWTCNGQLQKAETMTLSAEVPLPRRKMYLSIGGHGKFEWSNQIQLNTTSDFEAVPWLSDWPTWLKRSIDRSLLTCTVHEGDKPRTAWELQSPSLTLTLLIANSTWHSSQTHTHTCICLIHPCLSMSMTAWLKNSAVRPWFKLVTDWTSWRTHITISIAHLILETSASVNDNGMKTVNDKKVCQASQWQCEDNRKLRLKPLAVLQVLTWWWIRRNKKKLSQATPIKTFMLWCKPITCVAVARSLLLTN